MNTGYPDSAFLVDLAHDAGEIMLSHFNLKRDWVLKEDSTPLTKADTLINSMVLRGDKPIAAVICDPFQKRMWIAYKGRGILFADLSKFEARQEFISEDFFWNNAAAPEIYRHLWGVKASESDFELVPHLLGEDFIIEMSVIDDSNTLTKLLIENKLEESHVVPFIDTLVDTLATLTIERKDKLGFLYEKSLVQIMKDDIETLFVWIMNTSPNSPKNLPPLQNKSSPHLKRCFSN